MARPLKSGLDYFPLDCDLFTDRKLRRAKMKYGYLAIVVYIQLLCLIYKDKGYYLDYSHQDEVVWDILESIQGKYQPSEETVMEIIECLVASELFSGDQFKQNIITSTRVQSTFYSATSDRKAADVDFDRWLLSEEEMTTLSAKSMILQNFINRSNNPVNRADNPINRAVSTQSKEKESKVNESKVEQSTVQAPPTLQQVQDYCKDKFVQAERFYSYYQAKGWRSGNTPISDWRAMVDVWDQQDSQTKPKPPDAPSFDVDLLERMLDIVPTL